MPKITVSIIDKRIRDAYQNVIEGRPSFSETVLETKSLREAIERALAEMEKVQDYESVVVRDEKQHTLTDIQTLAVAMNGFVLYADYVDGKPTVDGRARFPKMGRIETTTERNELWRREENLLYCNYETL